MTNHVIKLGRRRTEQSFEKVQQTDSERHLAECDMKEMRERLWLPRGKG